MNYEYIRGGNLYLKRIQIKTISMDVYYLGAENYWMQNKKVVKLCDVYIITSVDKTISLHKWSLWNTITAWNINTAGSKHTNEFVSEDAGQTYSFVQSGMNILQYISEHAYIKPTHHKNINTVVLCKHYDSFLIITCCQNACNNVFFCVCVCVHICQSITKIYFEQLNRF